MRTLLHILTFLAPYKWYSLAAVASALLASAFNLGLPWLVKHTIDDVLLPGRLEALAPYILALMGVALLRIPFSVARRYLAGHVSLGVEFDMRQRLYRHLTHLDWTFYDGTRTGQLMSRATADIRLVRMFLGYGLIFFIFNLVTTVGIAFLLILIDPFLATLALLPAPALVLVARRFARRSAPVLSLVQQRLADLTTVAEESVTGIRVVKAYGREEAVIKRFSETSKEAYLTSLQANRLRARYIPAMEFLPTLGLVALLGMGGLAVMGNRLTIGELTAFISYLLLLIAPSKALGRLLNNAQVAITAGRRVLDLLETKPTVTDDQRAHAPATR